MPGWRQAMTQALDVARRVATWGDVPIGAVILGADGEVLSEAGNERERTGDPTAHAEVLAIRRAAEARDGWRLGDCTLVVTLEPCTMCAGTIVAARSRGWFLEPLIRRPVPSVPSLMSCAIRGCHTGRKSLQV